MLQIKVDKVNVLESTIIFLIGSCPVGFVYKDGYGFGKKLLEAFDFWEMGLRSGTRKVCGDKCLDNTNCLSFEHSEKYQKCFLVTASEPETDRKVADYIFCSKEGNMLGC